MLPYEPESVTSARDRFSAAIAETVDVELCKVGGETPGKFRKHVFDFTDGLRLIVSRDRHADGEVLIHFSASANPASALWKRVKRGKLRRKEFGMLATTRFAEISGFGTVKPAIVTFAGESEKGIPHWHVREITEQNALDIISPERN